MTEEEQDEAEDPFVRYAPAVALALVALAFLIRVYGLGEYWLNPDEGIYYSTLTRSSFGAFWAEVTANAHPPLFYLLLRGAGEMTWDFVMLRGISAVCGAVAVWAFWLVGRELGGAGRGGVIAGLVSAGLLAVNQEAITLSQVIRPYMMLSALVAGALYHLLRYRSDPSGRRLTFYAACVVAALLVHYSAALAFGAFWCIVAYYAVVGAVDRAAWRRLAVVQAAPALTLFGLYVWNLRRTISSDLMGDALGTNGWLSEWLIESPADVWHGFVTFQAYQLPPDFRGRAALLLLAVMVMAMVRNRLVAVATGAALAGAVAASTLGVYPFGPTRHDAWLVVFTLPALGWGIGTLVAAGARTARVAAAVLVLALLLGGPLEGAFGTDLRRSNATEERVVRQRDLAPLVVRQLDPNEGPPLILMSEQSYNLLVPLYADRREDQRAAPDSSMVAFSYGVRTILVARTWDWDTVDQLESSLADVGSVPGVTLAQGEPVLVVAGGWGSGLFAGIPQLQESEAILGAERVLGEDALGQPIVRVLGLVLDPSALAGGRQEPPIS